MPKIQNEDVQPANTRLMFRERLMNRFKAHEWVRVLNIDDEDYIWQFLPSTSESFEYTTDPMKITIRAESERYKLGAGESEVIVGENAYVMIEGLYKKLISKRVIAKVGEPTSGTPARSFNWTDPQMQEEYIDLIYQGKESPSFNDQPKVNRSKSLKEK